MHHAPGILPKDVLVVLFSHLLLSSDPFQFTKFWLNRVLPCFRAFANTIQRPFGVRYNPYTQSVEVLTNTQKIAAIVSELRGDMCIVSNALRKIHEHDETVDVESIEKMLHTGLNVSPVDAEAHE